MQDMVDSYNHVSILSPFIPYHAREYICIYVYILRRLCTIDPENNRTKEHKLS
jgi:hypothetical protein